MPTSTPGSSEPQRTRTVSWLRRLLLGGAVATALLLPATVTADDGGRGRGNDKDRPAPQSQQARQNRDADQDKQGRGGQQSQQSTSGGAISAKALTDHDCDSSEWHFIINQLNDGQAPATITVTFRDAAGTLIPVTVAHNKVTPGGVAHSTWTRPSPPPPRRSAAPGAVTSTSAMARAPWSPACR